MKSARLKAATSWARPQRGAATLLVVILLLLILTIAVSFGANVGLFEQRTSSNENRSRLAQQAAEAALGMTIEYLKANTANIVSTRSGTGWLDPLSSRWQSCTIAAPAGQSDPCLAERDPARRAEMYRYFNGGSTLLDYASVLPVDAQMNTVGGSANFPVTTQVSAVLCRLDTTAPGSPVCSGAPAESRSYAITLTSNASLTSEAAGSTVKETLASYRTFAGASTVPLVASGTVVGLGNAEIVTSPNAGGWGVPVSIWSPDDVDIESSSGAGVGSVSTCQMGEYLKSTPFNNLFTACTGGSACGCPGKDGWLSGHNGGDRVENIDVLDIDGNKGSAPDVTFFPSHRTALVGGVRKQIDNQADALDDSLFEWIFGQDVVDGTGAPGATQPNVSQNCGAARNQDCAKLALSTLATQTLANCSSLGTNTTGLIWVTGSCSLPSVLGSPTDPVVLVVEDNLNLGGNTVIYGMIFVRSSTNSATVSGRGNVTVFGSVLVEGSVNVSGGVTVVYTDVITQAINNSSAFNKLGRVPGSWLDSQAGF